MPDGSDLLAEEIKFGLGWNSTSTTILFLGMTNIGSINHLRGSGFYVAPVLHTILFVFVLNGLDKIKLLFETKAGKHGR